MPELSPTIFAVVVAVLVGGMLIVPRLRDRSKKPTTHELYFGGSPNAAAEQYPGGAPQGAPRAPSPTRAGVPAAKPPADRPQPLKLP